MVFFVVTLGCITLVRIPGPGRIDGDATGGVGRVWQRWHGWRWNVSGVVTAAGVGGDETVLDDEVGLWGTPTSSSWINQVERWFGFISDEVIRRGSHTSVQALEADIRAWANRWNEDPKPFIWTKPAEQILELISRLLLRK